LKDRVADVSDFVDALVRVGSGGTALDPEVVTQLMGASRRAPPSPPEHPGERGARPHGRGSSNGAIADALVISEGTVEKHVASISRSSISPSPSPITAGCCRAALPRFVTERHGERDDRH